MPHTHLYSHNKNGGKIPQNMRKHFSYKVFSNLRIFSHLKMIEENFKSEIIVMRESKSLNSKELSMLHTIIY